ncbi:MAG TPA: hypothetical protein VGE07_24930 [Herpetosiphonaceae bacterium]
MTRNAAEVARFAAYWLVAFSLAVVGLTTWMAFLAVFEGVLALPWMLLWMGVHFGALVALREGRRTIVALALIGAVALGWGAALYAINLPDTLAGPPAREAGR